MGPTNDSGRFRWIFTMLVGLIAAGGAIDLALDRPTMRWSLRVFFRFGLLAASTGAVACLYLGWRGSGRKLAKTRHALQALGVERDVWRTRTEKFLKRLGEESERTAQQHSVAMSRKSRLAGRAELSAFLLEDLLRPPQRGGGEGFLDLRQ